MSTTSRSPGSAPSTSMGPLSMCATLRFTSRTSLDESLLPSCESVHSRHSTRNSEPGRTEAAEGMSGCHRLCPGTAWSRIDLDWSTLNSTSGTSGSPRRDPAGLLPAESILRVDCCVNGGRSDACTRGWRRRGSDSVGDRRPSCAATIEPSRGSGCGPRPSSARPVRWRAQRPVAGAARHVLTSLYRWRGELRRARAVQIGQRGGPAGHQQQERRDRPLHADADIRAARTTTAGHRLRAPSASTRVGASRSLLLGRVWREMGYTSLEDVLVGFWRLLPRRPRRQQPALHARPWQSGRRGAARASTAICGWRSARSRPARS